MLGVYPFVERFVTKDDREHHLLERPRNAPVRTGHRHGRHHRLLGVHVRRGQRHHGDQARDVDQRHHPVLPGRPVRRCRPIVFWVTKRVCLALQRADRDTVLHGRETGTIIRTPDGKFFERHDTELTPEHWVLVQHDAVAPYQIEADVDGNGVSRRAGRADKVRAALSRFYFADAVNPVTPAELAAAHHDGHADEAIEASASGGARAIEAQTEERAGQH